MTIRTANMSVVLLIVTVRSVGMGWPRPGAPSGSPITATAPGELKITLMRGEVLAAPVALPMPTPATPADVGSVRVGITETRRHWHMPTYGTCQLAEGAEQADPAVLAASVEVRAAVIDACKSDLSLDLTDSPDSVRLIDFLGYLDDELWQNLRAYAAEELAAGRASVVSWARGSRVVHSLISNKVAPSELKRCYGWQSRREVGKRHHSGRLKPWPTQRHGTWSANHPRLI